VTQKENFLEKTCKFTNMDHGLNCYGKYEVMLNNISTETYLQETVPLSLLQTMSCEPGDVFLTGKVSREKPRGCG